VKEPESGFLTRSLRQWHLHILPTSWQQFDVEKLQPTLIACFDQQVLLAVILLVADLGSSTSSAYHRGITIQLALLSYVAQLTAISALGQQWREKHTLRLFFTAISGSLLYSMFLSHYSTQVNIGAQNSPWFTEASSAIELLPPLEYKEAESLFQAWHAHYHPLFKGLPLLLVLLNDAACTLRAAPEFEVWISEEMHATERSIENYKCSNSRPLAKSQSISYSTTAWSPLKVRNPTYRIFGSADLRLEF
jgi:hypothetical protein